MREVSAYIASGEWRGKAGGYNFTQRVEAGWPLDVRGDTDTVVGLPIRLVRSMLRQHGAARGPRIGVGA
jgi:septum formation protein